MTSKFNKKFTPSSSVVEDNEPKKEVEFKRDESDNKLFSEIQVKDIRGIITEDCVGYWDFDGVVYRVCSNMENRLIKVENKKEGIFEVLPNVTTFEGRGKSVSDTSWLGLKNIEREVEGKPPLTPDDFEVTPFQELKMEKEKALEQAKIQIFQKIKQVKRQYYIPRVKLILGSGDNFRMDLNQVRRYKGERDRTLRPLLLKEMRAWVLKELDSVFARPRKNGDAIEADDVSNWYGTKGYQTYLKTGRFDFLEISNDKDSLQSGKLLVNPDTHTGEHNPLRGKFKFPQAMLIEATHRSVGGVELIVKGGEKSTTKELKGYGFLYLMYQSILGKDQADGYSCLGHLDRGFNFGDVEAYKVLKPCKTAKDALQASIDVAAKLLPYGVAYTSHKGDELDIPTIEYINQYFLTAYMTRSSEDSMDFYKLCEAFKVDTSKIVDNNKLTHPIKTFVGDEEHLNGVSTLITSILKEDMKGLKAMKKADQGVVIDKIKEKLLSIDFESHYEMKQFDKGL